MLNGIEAVYGFCGWLTTRKEKTVMSSSDDAACIADLIEEFRKANGLPEPRDNWAADLTHPKCVAAVEEKPKILFEDGQPCKHKGCLSHLSHPCEGCGRIAGRGIVRDNPFLRDGVL